MSFEHRIDRLERSAARWRILAIGALGLLGAALVASRQPAPWFPGEGTARATEAANQKFDVLQVKKLQILGERGEEAIALEAYGGRGSLVIRGREGEGAIIAMFADGAPAFSVSGPNGDFMVGDSFAKLSRADPDKRRVTKRLADKLKAGESLSPDEKDEFSKAVLVSPAVELRAGENREGKITICNSRGRPVAWMLANEANEGSVFTADAFGKVKAVLAEK